MLFTDISGEIKAKQCSTSFFSFSFFQLRDPKGIPLKAFSFPILNRGVVSLHNIEPQRRWGSNGIASKTTNSTFVNNIKNTNKQAGNNTSIGHSKFMYTYILRKELSVGLEEGRKEENYWAMDKPCIFPIQGI